MEELESLLEEKEERLQRACNVIEKLREDVILTCRLSFKRWSSNWKYTRARTASWSCEPS